ncbi:hypothetical protein MRS44_005336 [Fusarium solani]|uniref:uncharacterized protein n=1 Tax=Fusarium solani TaxID=169388 RepID=UPI0032C4B143|nr:hypothetical protein MRS44_005336 [Fusarium solani]
MELAKFSVLPPSPAESLSENTLAAKNPRTRTRGRAIPRKGHTKSRKGCLNCKRRRVKCPETFPECDNCKRLGITCEYSSMIPSNALQSTPTQFSMEDLRFFHHFLSHAYPPLPIKGDDVWKQVATISHNFDFLMHALLGLAASHLSLCDTTEFSSQALTHRVHAIRLFNQRLSKPCVSKAEADARYATIMALTFQSSYMPEDMLEFMIMLRGCTVVSHTVIPVLEESLFSGFTAESHTERVLSLQRHDPVDALLGDVLDAALTSVNNLRPICHSVLEVRYLSVLDRILRLSKTSPVEGIACPTSTPESSANIVRIGFTEICLAYTLFGETSEVEFNHFTDRSNYAAQIIMAHFFVIEYILAAIALKPIIDSFPFRRVIIAAWTKEISKKLPSGYEEYIRWPLEFAELCHRKDGP